MWFRVLGGLEVTGGEGGAIPLPGPKPRALLVTLALHANQPVGLDALIRVQYGDDPPAGAPNAVQAQVSRLRKSLPDRIEFAGNSYRLRAEPDEVDALRFERLAAEGRQLLASGRPREAAEILTEALALWRGPALAELPDTDAVAARLAELRIAATEDRVEAELGLPDTNPVAELRALVAEHPLRERLRALLMHALHAAGRPAEALAEFESIRRLLADELGANPSAELTAAHRALLGAGTAPPPRRLPAQLTSFLGRDAELARLAELNARLITVLGPGGTGKTRLAVAFAATAGAAQFVDLSTVDREVTAAVLAALGLRGAGVGRSATDPVRQLVTVLDRELLLVLDNCEHVIDEVAELTATLLAECPRLRVLATSREPLRLTGEALLPLAPLPEPAAVRLFAERAAAVRPGFAVGQDNLATVTRICAALDGLPLAVELAAARLRQFELDEIADRLGAQGHFRLLSRGARTTARHGTLHAVVAWSWDLLGPAERTLAARFAGCAGGAPLDTLEALCGKDIDDLDDALAELVDKSIVYQDAGRYRMLEVIRLFCADRLAEAGDTDRLRAAHAEYHLDLARRADPHLRAAEQFEWLAMLSAEHANLMSALRWAAEHDRPTAMRLVAALAAYWWLSGRRREAGAVAARLLDTVPDELAEELDEEYVSCVVHAVPRAAEEHWTRAAALLRARTTELRHPYGAMLWGIAVGPPEDPQDRPPLGDDPWNTAVGRLSHGLIDIVDGRPAAGERALTDVLTDFRGLGERWGTAQALDWLATVASWRGEWVRAEELWAEALGLFDEFGAVDESVDLLCHRGESRLRQHQPDGAAADFREALTRAARAGYADPPPDARLGIAEVARLRGDPAAEALLTEALADPSARVYTALGRLAETTGAVADARRRHAEALAASRSAWLANDVAEALDGQAGAALVAGDAARAALLLGAAVAMRGMAVTGDQDVARIAAGARAALGSDTFATTYATGAALRRADAKALLD